jgi:hypothetical protein
VGLLINVHVVVRKDGVRKIVNHYDENPESQSARRKSAEDAEKICLPPDRGNGLSIQELLTATPSISNLPPFNSGPEPINARAGNSLEKRFT